MVTKWTPNGPRLMPEDNLSSVMAALAAAGAVAQPTRGAGQADVDGDAPPPPVPNGSSVLASALASVAAIDGAKLRAEKEEEAKDSEPAKPKVKSFTQINHVVPDGDGGFTKQSSVDRGTSNKALEAYKRRHVFDERKGKGPAHELDKGTMTDPEYKKVLARDEARMAESGVNPYLGANFNDI